MEFKGTKGKWEVDNDGVYSLDPLVLDNIVCLQPDAEFDSHKNWKANAQLISKAPEMLEMLKSCLSFFEELKDHGIKEWSDENKLRQLIKEAITI